MSFWSKAFESIAGIHKEYNNLALRVEYSEKSTTDIIARLEADLKDYGKRLTEIERQMMLIESKFMSEIANVKTLYEAVYKESILKSTNQITADAIATEVLKKIEENKGGD